MRLAAVRRARHAVGKIGRQTGTALDQSLKESAQTQEFGINDGPDTQPTAGFAGQSACKIYQPVGLGQNAFGRREQLLAGDGKSHASGCALEQNHPELLVKFFHLQ